MRTKRVLWLVGLWLGLAGRAPAGDCYFVAVFGAQRPLVKVPRYTHSFATFAHLADAGRLEAFTISWLPCSGRIRVARLEPEQGRNYSLDETLRFCAANGMEVACWGPYQVSPDLWARALAQKTRLESGQVLYKAFDDGSPDGLVSNCVHAVAFVARQAGERVPQIIVAPANWGESGSYWIALLLRPWYVEPCRTYDWLLPRLGVDPAGLVRNGLDSNPTRNPATRAIQAALHPQLLPNRVDCGR